MRRLFFQLVYLVSILLLGVSQNNAQDVQGDIYVEASVDNPTPFVGQQIIYTLRLYDAVSTTNPLYQPSDFDGFWRIDIGALSQAKEAINGRTYTVTSIATALYPNQVGEISIQPASIVLPETVFRSRTTLSASPVSISVQPLPIGQPADFSGGVGSFEMSATLDRQTASTGEPFTMQLTLKGTGNIEQLAPPTIPSSWRSSIVAGNYSSELQNGIVWGRRTYRVLFYPADIGKQTLPPISVSYFDPIGSIYRLVSTPSVEIEVVDDDLAGESAIPSSLPRNLQLKIVQNVGQSSLNLSFGILVLLLVLPLVIVSSILAWRWNDRIRQQQRVLRKQKYALQNAIQRIDRLKLLDVRSTYEQIDHILQVYVSDKLGRTKTVKDKQTVKSMLIAHDVAEGALDRIADLKVKIDEGLFAQPAQPLSSSEVQIVKQLFVDIDQNWVRQ